MKKPRKNCGFEYIGRFLRRALVERKNVEKTAVSASEIDVRGLPEAVRASKIEVKRPSSSAKTQPDTTQPAERISFCLSSAASANEGANAAWARPKRSGCARDPV